MWRLLPVAVLAGCTAKIEGTGTFIDAAIDAPVQAIDAAIDAPPPPPIDARLCAGGDAHVTAPDGSCLVFFRAAQGWEQGKTTCSGISAHLAILSTAVVDQAAETLVGNLDTFIGLTDAATEGAFLWVDGTALGFSNWETGEPNNGGGTNEDCAVIAGARTAKGWDDRPCAPNGNGAGAYAILCQF
jgi:hypothetical protein